MSESWILQMMTAAFLAMVVAAMLWDVRTRRIPNVLTMTGLCASLLMRGLLGADTLMSGLQGAGLALLVALPLFMLGGLGGGDLKLLVAVGGFVGSEDLLLACVLTALAGGVMAVWSALRGRGFLALVVGTGEMLKYFVTLGRNGSRKTLAAPGAMSIPYGVAIGMGSALAWFL